MKSRKGFIALCLVAALVASAAAVPAGRAGAARPTAVESQFFGAISLASGQGARVNVTNVLDATGLNFTVQFLDAEGQVLRREEQYLRPGQTGWVEFVPAAQTLSRRVATRAVVESVPDAPEITARQLVGTLEVFQVKTQMTSLVIEPQMTLYR